MAKKYVINPRFALHKQLIRTFGEEAVNLLGKQVTKTAYEVVGCCGEDAETKEYQIPIRPATQAELKQIHDADEKVKKPKKDRIVFEVEEEAKPKK